MRSLLHRWARPEVRIGRGRMVSAGRLLLALLCLGMAARPPAGKAAEIHETTTAPAITVTLAKETDNLVGPLGSPIGPFIAYVRYPNGKGLPGIPLTFTISQPPAGATCTLSNSSSSGSGSETTISVTTAQTPVPPPEPDTVTGSARVWLTAENVEGDYQITVSSPNLQSQVFAATAFLPPDAILSTVGLDKEFLIPDGADMATLTVTLMHSSGLRLIQPGWKRTLPHITASRWTATRGQS